ncbi:MAG: ABC transporter ATP-binding protein, partial [Rickettsiales bacterium]|nr:ABC transporter ATP-binding protein [Rickettsiales bacterium]
MKKKSEKNDKKQKPGFIATLKPFKRLFKESVRKYLGRLVIAGLLMIIVAVCTSVVAYIVGPTINKVFLNKETDLLLPICLLTVFVYLVKTVSTYIQNIILKSVCTLVTTDLCVSMFAKIIKLPMKEIHKMTNGKLLTLFLNDINRVGNSISELFVTTLRDVLICAFLLGVVFYNDWFLAVVAFILYPFVLMPIARLSKKLKQDSNSGMKNAQVITAKFNDVFNGLKTIKSYNAERIEERNMRRLLLKRTRISLSFIRRSVMGSPLMEMVSGTSVALVIFIGGYRIINGTCDVGKFFSFFTALLMFLRPTKSLSGINAKIQECVNSLDRIYDFADNVCTEELIDGSKPEMEDATIKFENVCFDYYYEPKTIQDVLGTDDKRQEEEAEDKDDTFAIVAKNINEKKRSKYKIAKILEEEEQNQTFATLNDINIEIKPHSKVAFVGSSGCGKSTLVNLLMKLYEYSKGKISINGVDIKDISTKYLRKNIAYIGQDNFLFDDTIRNNILYGTAANTVDSDTLERAVELAQINFLEQERKGIDAKVGCSGSLLSLGQRQRIAIARAIVKDAPIVILDEATSA